MCPRGASEEISSTQFLFWDPLHISVTNEARKLKFGTLVGISVLYKNLSARGRMGKSGAPTLYFGIPFMSPKLIELES